MHIGIEPDKNQGPPSCATQMSQNKSRTEVCICTTDLCNSYHDSKFSPNQLQLNNGSKSQFPVSFNCLMLLYQASLMVVYIWSSIYNVSITDFRVNAFKKKDGGKKIFSKHFVVFEGNCCIEQLFLFRVGLSMILPLFSGLVVFTMFSPRQGIHEIRPTMTTTTANQTCFV